MHCTRKSEGNVTGRRLPAIRTALAIALVGASGLWAGAAQAASISSIYGVKLSIGASAQGQRNSRLFQINAATNTVNSIVVARLGGATVYLDGLAISSTGDLYGFVADNAAGTGNVDGLTPPATPAQAPNNYRSRLVSVDPATGTLTAVGAQRTGAVHSGAAFNLADQLWALNHYATTLERIDPATGTVLQTVPVTLPAGGAWPNTLTADLAFDVDDTAFLALGADIYRVDLATGNATLVVNRPADGYLALGFYRNNEVWSIEANGLDDVRYAASGDVSAWTAVPGLGDLSTTVGNANSGAMDFASVPNRVTATPDAYALDVNSPGITLNPLARASNVRNWPMTLNVLTGPTQGTLDTSGTLPVYIPAPNYVGPDSFTYQACTLPTGTCATTTVSLTVRAAPVAVPTLGTAGLASMALWMAWLGRRRRRH